MFNAEKSHSEARPVPEYRTCCRPSSTPVGARRSVLEVESGAELKRVLLRLVGEIPGGAVDLEPAQQRPRVADPEAEHVHEGHLQLHAQGHQLVLDLEVRARDRVGVPVVGDPQELQVEPEAGVDAAKPEPGLAVDPVRVVLAHQERAGETEGGTQRHATGVAGPKADLPVEAVGPHDSLELSVLEVLGAGRPGGRERDPARVGLRRPDVHPDSPTSLPEVQELDGVRLTVRAVGVAGVVVVTLEDEGVQGATRVWRVRVPREGDPELAVGAELAAVVVPLATAGLLEPVEHVPPVGELHLPVEVSLEGVRRRVPRREATGGAVPELELDVVGGLRGRRPAPRGSRGGLGVRGVGEHPQHENREHQRDDPVPIHRPSSCS